MEERTHDFAIGVALSSYEIELRQRELNFVADDAELAAQASCIADLERIHEDMLARNESFTPWSEPLKVNDWYISTRVESGIMWDDDNSPGPRTFSLHLGVDNMPGRFSTDSATAGKYHLATIYYNTAESGDEALPTLWIRSASTIHSVRRAFASDEGQEIASLISEHAMANVAAQLD